MSGGSYNYLATTCRDDLGELLTRRADLQRMADRLAGLGYAKDAALETESLILVLRQIEIRVEARVARLADVWRAVEWWDSGDYGEDAVRGALAEYREET